MVREHAFKKFYCILSGVKLLKMLSFCAVQQCDSALCVHIAPPSEPSPHYPTITDSRLSSRVTRSFQLATRFYSR